MFGGRETAVLLAAALFVACESVSEPEIAPPPPRLAIPGPPEAPPPPRGAVFSSVVGGGQVDVGGVLRDFSFNALDQRGPQGTKKSQGALVVGEFDMFDPTANGRVHGIITCFGFPGPLGEALIGGQVRPPAGGVVEVGFRVVDNPNKADQMSDLITHNVDFCAGGAGSPALTAIEAGNITVRDVRPPSF